MYECDFLFFQMFYTQYNLMVLFFRQIISENLHSNFFPSPSNQCGEQQDVIDNDIEIDRLNPILQFKVPKQMGYIHAIQCREGSWQELPIDK